MSDLPTFRERLRIAVAAQPRPRWKALERRSGYSVGYIRDLMHDRRHSPTLGCVYALAGALNVRPAWLLGLDND